MRKYPKTHHVEGSDGRPPGDGVVPLSEIDCQFLTAEVKLDGSHFAFENDDGYLRHWHRNTEITGQPEFSLLKAWTGANWLDIVDLLGDRYEVHGEWCYARHTVPYTALPCYAFHTDIYDREEERWLSTPFRRNLLLDLCDDDFQPIPVIGCWKPEEFQKRGFADELLRLVEQMPEKHLFGAPECEGLFLKAERGGQTVGFYKFIRPGFVRSVVESDHWKNRDLIVNGRA